MMKYKIVLLAAGFAALVSCKKDGTSTTKTTTNHNFSGVTVDTDSESEKFSYSIGMILGNTLKNAGVDSVNYGIIDRAFADNEDEQITYTFAARQVQDLMGEEVDMSKVDRKIIKRAISDALGKDTTLMTLQEVSQSYQGFMQSNQTRVAQLNLDEGKAFLEANKAKEGILVSESGLQYQLIQEGTGEKPGKNDVVEVWFSAENLNGHEFKKDLDEATGFVDLKDGTSDIPALAEAVSLFPAGSEFLLYVPSNLAFGEARISPEVGPNSTVKIHVSKTALVDNETKAAYRKQKEEYFKQLRQAQQQRR